MAYEIIHSEDRGATKTDWLDSKHTYSFGQYYDQKRMQFGTLRVVNDDIIEAGKGFGTHSHDNMEIVTIVLDGVCEHKDSMGNHGVIKAGEIQRMTAGSGIRHSEFNHSKTDKLHLLQIWVYPEKRDLTPSYDQKQIEYGKNVLKPIISRDHADQALAINQDATFYMGQFDKGQGYTHHLKSAKHGDYVFIIDGEVKIGDQILKKGDSVHVTQMGTVELQALENSKVLVIEVSIS